MFAEVSSGEWDGVSATFDAEGTPRELPEYYVPQAYRDWDVQLYDWQTQCSMNCDVNGMSYTLRKLMPTVGCEADAIAFTEDRTLGFQRDSSNFAFSADGKSTASPGKSMKDSNVFECRAEHIIPIKEDRRVRMTHIFKKMGPDRVWTVHAVEVHIERRDGPFTGKRELAGCGGGMDAFAKREPVQIDELKGSQWFIASDIAGDTEHHLRCPKRVHGNFPQKIYLL